MSDHPYTLVVDEEDGSEKGWPLRDDARHASFVALRGTVRTDPCTLPPCP